MQFVPGAGEARKRVRAGEELLHHALLDGALLGDQRSSDRSSSSASSQHVAMRVLLSMRAPGSASAKNVSLSD